MDCSPYCSLYIWCLIWRIFFLFPTMYFLCVLCWLLSIVYFINFLFSVKNYNWSMLQLYYVVIFWLKLILILLYITAILIQSRRSLGSIWSAGTDNCHGCMQYLYIWSSPISYFYQLAMKHGYIAGMPCQFWMHVLCRLATWRKSCRTHFATCSKKLSKKKCRVTVVFELKKMS